MPKFIILTRDNGDSISVPIEAIRSLIKLEAEEQVRVYFKENAVLNPSKSDSFYLWDHVVETIESITNTINKAV